MNKDAPSVVPGGLVRGQLDALMLASLEDGPLHGYAISESLARRSGGHLHLPTGTLYPALHRVEAAGWVTSEWSRVGGRRRRTYRLTGAGRGELARRREDWTLHAGIVSGLLGT